MSCVPRPGPMGCPFPERVAASPRWPDRSETRWKTLKTLRETSGQRGEAKRALSVLERGTPSSLNPEK
jgi:hypothetical protein